MTKQPHPNQENNFTNREKFQHPEKIFAYKWNDLKSIKSSCIVSLDTNVLLVPYKLRKESVEAIGVIYKDLHASNRLFITKQTAREFAANKSSKISEIAHEINGRKMQVKNIDYPILVDTSEYKELISIVGQLTPIIKSYNNILDKISKAIKQWVWNDPVVQLYSEVFSEANIVDHKLSDSEFLEDQARRKKFKIPPGYKDAAKDENSEGDLAIWHAILELGRSKKEDMIFVSEDRKPDWWTKSGGSALIPRYELIHEYQNASNGKSLHFMILSEFLEAFEVPDTIVDNVKSEEFQDEEKSAITKENDNIIKNGATPLLIRVSPEIHNRIKFLNKEQLNKALAENLKELLERSVP